MGFSVELNVIGSFIYNIKFDNGLIEHELDYILVGKYNGDVKISSDEVDDWKWMSLENIKNDIKVRPDNYTEWFKIIIDNYFNQFISLSITALGSNRNWVFKPTAVTLQKITIS